MFVILKGEHGGKMKPNLGKTNCQFWRQ